MMKAIQFDRLGGAEVMELREVPSRSCVPVRCWRRITSSPSTTAIPSSFAAPIWSDPDFPTPGIEASGIIAAAAPDLKGLQAGMRVAYIGMGAYAELTLIGASRVTPIPDDMTFEQAASFPIAVLTAWHMLHTCNDTKPGEFVIVHSAAGRVGIAAMQIAKAAGARVIGTVSSDDKVALVKQFGAHWVINYESQDFAEQALRLTDRRGVNLILDAVGQPTFEKGVRCLAPARTSDSLWRAGGAPSPISPLELFGKSFKVSGFAVTMMYVLGDHHRRAL
jgi:NADPH2:quinone reductase